MKVALAALRASRGDASVLPALRRAITQGVVPADLSLSDEHTYVVVSDSCWNWICQVLHSWRDEAIVADLTDMTVREVRESGTFGSAERFITAAAIFRSDSYCATLLDLWETGFRDIKDLHRLARVVTEPSAFRIAKLAFSSLEVDVDAWRLSQVMRAVGEVAVDPETARLLQDHVAAADGGSDVYEAIHAISRRGRFRLMQDGSVAQNV